MRKDELADNARAEAWRRFPDGIDVETGEPVDDYGYPETAREAFIDGAEWAAGRAETTTATAEDVQDAAEDVIATVRDSYPRTSDDAPSSEVAQALAERGLLATVHTRPTRDDLILALAQADGQAWPDGMDDHTANHMYGKQADAVLALLGGLPEPVAHRPVHIWQERPGEISWTCACGTIYKHQPFGAVAYRCEAGESL